ncbi:unnamed protein product, partial [Adineta ricciae]
MFSSIILIFLIPSVMTTPINLYRNAYFSPFDSRYLLSNLSSINSTNSCLCQCSSDPLCSTLIYSSKTQFCILFFANLNQGQLKLVTTNTDTNVYSFNNRSSTTGGNSLAAYSGYQPGSYWPTQPAVNIFDGNLTTEFTSHGVCNISLYLSRCGQNTGFYFTPQSGSMILAGFRLGTNIHSSLRDPLLMTIEGSNSSGSSLTSGSSWT